MRFGTWNVRHLYRAGSLTAAARELARCKLDLVSLQEVRAGYYNFFCGKEMKIINCEQDFLYTTVQYQQLRE